ncbi:MAG: hypothetical protein LBR21_10220, partial [Propionibacteriaceae bacterium]|nr:hypothetical protein [Propionibacteriaceae bacterium]
MACAAIGNHNIDVELATFDNDYPLWTFWTLGLIISAWFLGKATVQLVVFTECSAHYSRGFCGHGGGLDFLFFVVLADQPLDGQLVVGPHPPGF